MNLIRRAVLWLMVLLILPGMACAESEYWVNYYDHPVVCCDHRIGCEVLQMVMRGAFAQLDGADSLGVRIMSAALPALCDVADADFTHFCNEFPVEESSIRRLYYIAVGSCLKADILSKPDVGGDASVARQLLWLFLDPQNEEDSSTKIERIRADTDETLIERIADETGLPTDFISYLLLGKDEHGNEG